MADGKPGKRKGWRAPQTLDKIMAREKLRELVTSRMEPMTLAQIDSAIGIKHFMLRDKSTGQFKRITDAEEIQRAMNAEGAEEGSTYWIYTKDPSTSAFTDLMNRALDKPKEQEQELKFSGGLEISWIE